MTHVPYPTPKGSIPCVHPALEIRYHVETGRGVYATQDMPRATLLSHSPLLLFHASQTKHTPLEHYTYSITRMNEAGQPEAMQAVALGLGSLFNHSEQPNVDWRMNREEGYITYRTARTVSCGEALTISYGDTSWMPGGRQASREEEEEEDEIHVVRESGRDEHGLLFDDSLFQSP